MKPYLSSVLILLSYSTNALLFTLLHRARKINTAGSVVSKRQTRESSESIIQSFLVTNGNDFENEFGSEKLQSSRALDNEQSKFFTGKEEGQIDLLYDR